MARYPRIQSPCPYKSDLAAVMEGNFCRMCRRNVIDLTGWSDAERSAFLQGCETEVCVSYRLPVRGALAAAALAASVAALPVAATPNDDIDPFAQQALAAMDDGYDEIIVGGIKDPKNTEWVEDVADAAIPELPVIYEDAPADPARSTGS